MLNSLIERFRTWNHTRMALRDRADRPQRLVDGNFLLDLSKKERAAICRSLTISDRGVTVTDLEYASRLTLFTKDAA